MLIYFMLMLVFPRSISAKFQSRYNMVLLECMQVTFEHCISDITLRTTDVLNAICRSLAKKDKKDAKDKITIS